MLKSALLTGILLFGVSSALASGSVVISQVYGGGGLAGAPYLNDYIEIFNRSNGAIDLSGWSVQYSAAGTTTWSVTPLTNVILQPGQHYLVAEATSGSGNGVPLPTPDATGTINMDVGRGKVVIVNGTTALSGNCPATGYVDLVGYGASGCFEGAVNAPATGAQSADFRAAGGCSDTDNNGADFTAGGPAPRNSATPLAPCGTTAAEVEIAGRILDAQGFGVRGARVVFRGQDGVFRTAVANAFGYYKLTGVQAGSTYVVQPAVRGQNYQPRVINVSNSLTDVDFAPFQ